MKISYNWLKDYLECDLAPEAVAEALTSIGLEVDSLEQIEEIPGGLKGVIVAEVVECVEHPDSDHLHITKLNTGEPELLQVVCGAPNVAAGQKVLLATVGTVLGEDFKIKNTVDAISHATCGMAIDIGAKAIAVCTLSGMTARMVSRFRPPMDIIGVTTNERTWRKLALSWGITPVMCEKFNSTDVLFYTAKNIAKSTLALKKDDLIVITGGITGQSGNTDLIKVEKI